jgi:hypothetical protein
MGEDDLPAFDSGSFAKRDRFDDEQRGTSPSSGRGARRAETGVEERDVDGDPLLDPLAPRSLVMSGM